jgi:hypothetical protein
LDGVLGQSWLTRFDYLIDVDRGQLILDGEIPPGTRIPLLLVDGRPAISLQVNGSESVAVLDSGAPVMVLFGEGTRNGIVQVATNNGSREASQARAYVTAGDFRGLADAVVVPGQDTALLPLRTLRRVFVSNGRKFVVLGQTPR